MIYPVPYKAEHVWQQELQPAQAYFETGIRLDYLRQVEGPYAHTLMLDGVPIASAGAFPLHENRALLWAYLMAAARGPLFRVVHSNAKLLLSTLPFRRVEAIVDAEFEAGHRWMRLLGFKRETPEPMQAYTPNGRASVQYALVRP